MRLETEVKSKLYNQNYNMGRETYLNNSFMMGFIFAFFIQPHQFQQHICRNTGRGNVSWKTIEQKYYKNNPAFFQKNNFFNIFFNICLNYKNPTIRKEKNKEYIQLVQM